jgi:hypothetical protein
MYFTWFYFLQYLPIYVGTYVSAVILHAGTVCFVKLVK